MPIRHNYQATGVNDGAKQVSVDRWNDGHVIDSEVDLPVLATDPAAPADGFLTLYGKKIGGRTMLSQMGPYGLDTALQPNLGGNKVALWMPPGNSTTAPGVFGMSALTVTGTAAARTVSTTNVTPLPPKPAAPAASPMLSTKAPASPAEAASSVPATATSDTPTPTSEKVAMLVN